MDLCCGSFILFFTTYGVVSFTKNTISFISFILIYFFNKKLPESDSESESESDFDSGSEIDNLELDPDYVHTFKRKRI